MKNIITPKKTKVLAVVFALIVLSIAIIYFISNRKHPEDISSTAGTTYSPPTEEEKKQAEDNKKELEKRIELESKVPVPTNQNVEKKNANPIVSSAGQYENTVEVSSFISDVYEDGGQCKFTLSKDQYIITKNLAGLKDARTTRCPLLKIPRNEFLSTGNWTVKMIYESEKYQGTSNTFDFEVR